MALRVRPVTTADADASAAVLHAAFAGVYRRRGHNPPFPTLDSATWLVRAYLDLDPHGSLLAEHEGTIVGVGFVHPRGPVASIGPLAARPGARSGVGRALMAHLAAVAAGSQSLRLFQDAFNPDSFGLYSRLGFLVRDVAPYLVAAELGAPPSPPPGVRALDRADLPAVRAFDRARSRSERGADLELLARHGAALLHENHAGEIDGYLFHRPLPARVVIGPGVADSVEAMTALIDGLGATQTGRPAVVRASAGNPAVLERAFARGFRVDHLGNLMVRGEFDPPAVQIYALFPESL